MKVVALCIIRLEYIDMYMKKWSYTDFFSCGRFNRLLLSKTATYFFHEAYGFLLEETLSDILSVITSFYMLFCFECGTGVR